MVEFIHDVLAHIAADIIVIAFGAVLTLAIALRNRWRLFGAVIRLWRNGVSNLYINRSEYISRRSRSVGEMIESAERDFAYIGIYFSLATDQSRIDNSIRNLIAKKCRVTIALLDSEAPQPIIGYLEGHLAFAADTLAARARHALDHFIGLRETLAPADRINLDIRLHQIPLTTSAFIIDQDEETRTILIDQKWYSIGRDKSFGIEFSKRVGDDSLQANILTSFQNVLAVSRRV